MKNNHESTSVENMAWVKDLFTALESTHKWSVKAINSVFNNYIRNPNGHLVWKKGQ